MLSNHASYDELAQTNRLARSMIAMARRRFSIAALVIDQSVCAICASAGGLLSRAMTSSISSTVTSAPP
ncbi:MAG TPA: hypothetical protein DHU71_08820 [Erythrobacter sp.]|nr:hypothetical protein [Erythrobacter sp.]